MQNDPLKGDLPPADRELERALAGLHPARPGGGIDRDRAQFDAGLRRGRRQANAWRGATGALVLALGASLAWRPAADGGGADRIASVPPVPATTVVSPTPIPVPQPPAVFALDDKSNRPSSPGPVAAGSGGAYLSLRAAVLLRGVDAVADPHARRRASFSEQTPTVGDLLRRDASFSG